MSVSPGLYTTLSTNVFRRHVSVSPGLYTTLSTNVFRRHVSVSVSPGLYTTLSTNVFRDMSQSQSHLVSILHYLQMCLEDMSQSQSHLVSILHYLQTCLEDMALSQCQSHLVSVLQVVSETCHFILQLLYPQSPVRRLLDTQHYVLHRQQGQTGRTSVTPTP